MVKAAFKTYSRVGGDFKEVKQLAELDAPSLSNINGRQYAWAVNMTPGVGKLTRKNCFKAEIHVFETEMERDLYVLNKNGFYSINRPVNPN